MVELKHFVIIGNSLFKIRFFALSALSASLLLNCSGPQKSLPGAQVMHFPFAMAIKGDRLLVSSENSDGKYGYGRLVSLDTKAIHNELKNLKPEETIPWENVVKSNVLIPPGGGPISFEDQIIIFASGANNTLYSAIEPLCNEPSQIITSCAQSASLELSENDPYALAILQQQPKQDYFLVSYLSSGRIDLVELDKKPKSPMLRALKSFYVDNLVDDKLKGDFFTKKVMVSKPGTKDARVFLLLERKPSKEYIHARQDSKSTFKLASLQKNMGAFLLSFDLKKLLEKDTITSADVSVVDLQELFGVYLAQDFYINDVDNTATILARSPEVLIKIHLEQKTLLEKQLVCRGAGSMAVNPNLDRIFIPCFSDNRVISLKLSSLALMGASGIHGRGPAFAAVDEAHKVVFVSYNTDGKVGIFDFDMNYLGHVFQPAPINRVGS